MGAKTRARKQGKKSHKPENVEITEGNGSISGNGAAAGTDSVRNGAVSIATAAMQSGKRFDDWTSFVRHLHRRKRPRPGLSDLFGAGKAYALAWAWPRDLDDPDPDRERFRKCTSTICRVLAGKRKLKSRDVRWLSEFADSQQPAAADLEYARLAIALASILPRLAEVAGEGDWWQALKNLIGLTDVAQPLADADVVARQMLTIELPLTLARQLPEIPACAALAEPAAEFLMVEQSELLDTDGWPQARNIPAVPQLLATWTRGHYLLEDLGKPLDNSSQAIWEWFVRQSLRMLRGDGTWMFSGPSLTAVPELLEAAVATSNDRTDHRIARIALPWLGNGKRADLKLDKEESFSEWAGVGLLHAGWTPGSPRVGILTEGSAMQIEVCRGQQLFRVTAPAEISQNGRPLKPVTDWEVVCDHVDDDVEHLELERELEQGVRMQRQICLARHEQFLLLADIVLGKTSERIDYGQTLELGPGISTVEETETREVYLRDPKRICSLVLPLGLPEWKSETCDHKLACSTGQIRLSQSALCRNMYAGWFVDLSPRRSKHPRTWRRLTVGQSLQIVPADVAVAFRIRIGPDQFVIYRSLDENDNRTFLGQNHSCEFFLGRLKKDGNVTELISIEP